MAAIASVGQTKNQDIDALLAGAKWATLNLTYSFPSKASFYGSGYGEETEDNFEALNASQMAAARKIFGMIAAVTNLTFTEVTETASSHAVLRLAQSGAPPSAWAYYPDPTEYGGDSWFGNSTNWYDSPVRGGYGFYTFMHEIAHALGLKHGNDSDGFGPMTAAHDSMEYSVTTYKSYVGASGQYLENETWGYAQSLMMYDIAALQHMYGADFSTNSGNTVYRWDPATGQSFLNGVGQGAPGGNRIFQTVWDGGGSDTYDFSNYSTNLTVDLRPGTWSKVSNAQLASLGPGEDARGNIANALLYHGDTRSLIENAKGGSGSDQITGNTAANTLQGGAGSDRLLGREGNDKLYGGTGNDTLSGGSGKDAFYFDSKANKSTNLDKITDFSVPDDTIRLENSVFTGLKAGALSSAAFWIGTKAHDSSDRIVYNKSTGALLFDVDGTGSAAATQFATLPKNLKMTAADFYIV